METILIPTDFSDTARGAFEYAQQLTAANTTNFRTVHVYQPDIDSSQLYLGDAMTGNLELKQQQLEHFTQLNSTTHPETVKTLNKIEKEVKIGFTAETIVELSAEPAVNMIVMGTTGESGLLEKIFGSISSHVAQKAHCPVLLIPKGIPFIPYKKILYASNFPNIDKAILQGLPNCIKHQDATIEMVHIQKSKLQGYQIESVETNSKNPHVKNVLIKSNNVLEGLTQYITENEVDLVIMATMHRSFLEGVFHKSLTKKMVFSISTPLLILHFDD